MKIGTNRKVTNLEVSDKVFKIGIFPVLAEYKLVENDLTEKEFEKLKSPTNDQLNEKNQRQFDIQTECIEAILEANGYEFDKDWWLSHLDILGLSEFIIYSKSKDIIPNIKKKEVIASH